MKVKLFERLERGEMLDADINAWLEANPSVHVRNTQLSTHLVDNERGLPNLAAVCLILYDEV